MTTPESTMGYDDKDLTGTRKLDASDTRSDKTRPVLTTPAASAERPAFMQTEAGAEMNQRWQQVQTEFVDNPRESVSHAHKLVSDAVQRIVDTFTQERNALERQWAEGQDVSTEDLRVCLQRYREFFARLLPLEAAK